MYFKYDSKEIEFLKGHDKLLGAAIDRIGHIYRAVVSVNQKVDHRDNQKIDHPEAVF